MPSRTFVRSVLFAEFEQRLRSALPDQPLEVLPEKNGPRLRIAAAHPEIGDLVIWDDGDQITIAMGEHVRVHASVQASSGLIEPQEIHLAASQAVELVRDILSGELVHYVIKREGRVRQAGMLHRGEVPLEDPEGELSIHGWKGPIPEHP